MLKTIYTGVIAPMLLYGAEVWGIRGNDSRVNKQLNAAQRPFLLAITRAYRTAPTAALQVLAGVPPPGTTAMAMHAMENTTGNTYEKRIEARDLIHPADRGLINIREWRTEIAGGFRTRAYTDGSEAQNKTGYGIAIAEDETWTQTISGRLSDGTTAAQAELAAIEKAVEATADAQEPIAVISDARGALLAIAAVKHHNETARRIYDKIRRSGKNYQLLWTKGHQGETGNTKADDLAKEGREKEITEVLQLPKSRRTAELKRKEREEWQSRWDGGETGRLLHSIHGGVRNGPMMLSRKAVQLVTGHGNMPAYYSRFRLREVNAECDCGGGLRTGAHILLDCENEQGARHRLKEAAHSIGYEWPIKIRHAGDPKIWHLLNEFADEAIEDEEAETGEEKKN